MTSNAGEPAELVLRHDNYFPLGIIFRSDAFHRSQMPLNPLSIAVRTLVITAGGRMQTFGLHPSFLRWAILNVNIWGVTTAVTKRAKMLKFDLLPISSIL
jgi:hypothetical protein